MYSSQGYCRENNIKTDSERWFMKMRIGWNWFDVGCW